VSFGPTLVGQTVILKYVARSCRRQRGTEPVNGAWRDVALGAAFVWGKEGGQTGCRSLGWILPTLKMRSG
jgi:hypothetical protein